MPKPYTVADRADDRPDRLALRHPACVECDQERHGHPLPQTHRAATRRRHHQYRSSCTLAYAIKPARGFGGSIDGIWIGDIFVAPEIVFVVASKGYSMIEFCRLFRLLAVLTVTFR